jgi:F0F1-type ATP synthase epsilon subunit
VVLPHHEPLTAITSPGPVTIVTKEGGKELFASFGGMIEISDNTVRLLLDEVDHAKDLVESDIKAALAAAQQQKAKAKDQTELAEAQRLIDRQAVRLEVAQIRRKYRG